MWPFLRHLSKQYNLGPWLGGFKDLASRTMIYVSVLSFTQISATFYYTTLKPPFEQYIPWINFGWYFLVLVTVVLVLMLLEFKFMVPSSYTFSNKQEYTHRNLIREDLEKVLGRQEEILNRLSVLEEELNKLNKGEEGLNENRDSSPNK